MPIWLHTLSIWGLLITRMSYISSLGKSKMRYFILSRFHWISFGDRKEKSETGADVARALNFHRKTACWRIRMVSWENKSNLELCKETQKSVLGGFEFPQKLQSNSTTVIFLFYFYYFAIQNKLQVIRIEKIINS